MYPIETRLQGAVTSQEVKGASNLTEDRVSPGHVVQAVLSSGIGFLFIVSILFTFCLRYSEDRRLCFFFYFVIFIFHIYTNYNLGVAPFLFEA